MKTAMLIILALFLLIETVSAQVSHEVITNRKIALLNKGSNRVLSVMANTNPVGALLEVADFNENTPQIFQINDIGNGNFNIIRTNNLFLSLKFSAQPGGLGRTVVQDNKYIHRPVCNTALIANCPTHQTWIITPVAGESQTFTIKNRELNKVLQANIANSNVSVENDNGSDFQKWIIAETNDLILAPFATADEISQLDDIVSKQFGVAVLNGDTTKPFYFHHNKPNETIYKYKKKVHTPSGVFPSSSGRMDAWFPVSEFRETVCGRVHQYKQCTQDFWHNGSVSLDIDANLHITPNEKFKHMLKNPRMESYANGQYFKQRLTLWCQQPQFFNCMNEGSKRRAEEIAKAEVKELLDKFDRGTLEGEFTPSMSGNPVDVPDKRFMNPINPLFSFAPINMGRSVCAYGPWMWERILYSDWAIVGLFKDSHFNNEIHPANQIWFVEDNTLHLIGVVDQTGIFEVPQNPSNTTEVHASGLNQRMRFHVAFIVPAATLNGGAGSVVEYHVNAKSFKMNNVPAVNVPEIVTSRKYKNIPRFSIRDNSFIRLERNHRVFLENVRKRADGSVQGYMVVETEPITRRGGSINIFVKKS